MNINLFDSHVHSDSSPDGCETTTFICETAITKGLSGVSITDHCEMDSFERLNFGRRMAQSCFAAKKAKDIFSKQLIVTSGIEIGQPMADVKRAEEVIGKENTFDFVLGAIHTLPTFGRIYNMDYSAVDIDAVLGEYFAEMYKMVKWNGIDSLAHLGYPLRYIANCGLTADISKHDDVISEMLRLLAENGKGLELNTGGLRQKIAAFTPSNKYLKMFRDYGGEIITIGSDAHRCTDIGNGISGGMEILKEVGFTYFTFFKDHNPIMLKLL